MPTIAATCCSGGITTSSLAEPFDINRGDHDCPEYGRTQVRAFTGFLKRLLSF